jgi:hypothetical protein
MSDVGTSIVWIEPEPEPEHRWYTPGTSVVFVKFCESISLPLPVLAH